MKPKIKLVAIAKNEAAYLPQWIHHHFQVGFNEIEIYINDTTDNSVAICEKIKTNHPGLTFQIADQLRSEAIQQNSSFQISAYNQSLHQQGGATHLMALDLDEYLVAKNLDDNLQNLLRRQKTPDCLSFLWYSDHFNHKDAFTHPIQKKNTIHRMDHVKTVSKISGKIHSCSHHNFIYKKDDKIINLLGGTIIRLDDRINAECNRSKLSKQQLNALSSEQTEPWFVLHCIYKSEPEYLASLCRGRGHNNDQRPLKVNRWGMAPYPFYCQRPIEWRPDADQVERYQRSLNQFIQENDLEGELQQARNDILNTAKNLDDLLNDQPNLRKDYQKIFTGTQYALQ